MPVLIHRSCENVYELFATRTFALAVWEWLTDTALPFGYDIVVSDESGAGDTGCELS
jgi:hypothetical protein